MAELKCPRCGSVEDVERVIYYGLPYKMCFRGGCSTMWGGFVRDLLLEWLPFNGWMMVYRYSYPRALWTWLRGAWESDHD